MFRWGLLVIALSLAGCGGNDKPDIVLRTDGPLKAGELAGSIPIVRARAERLGDDEVRILTLDGDRLQIFDVNTSLRRQAWALGQQGKFELFGPGSRPGECGYGGFPTHFAAECFAGVQPVASNADVLGVTVAAGRVRVDLDRDSLERLRSAQHQNPRAGAFALLDRVDASRGELRFSSHGVVLVELEDPELVATLLATGPLPAPFTVAS